MELSRFEKSIIKKMSVLFELIEGNDEELREHSGELFSEDFVALTKVFMNVERGIYDSYEGREDKLEEHLQDLNRAYKFQTAVKEKGAANVIRETKEDERWKEIDEILTAPSLNNETHKISAIKKYKDVNKTDLRAAKEAIDNRIIDLVNRGTRVTGFDMNGKRLLR